MSIESPPQAPTSPALRAPSPEGEGKRKNELLGGCVITTATKTIVELS